MCMEVWINRQKAARKRAQSLSQQCYHTPTFSIDHNTMNIPKRNQNPPTASSTLPHTDAQKHRQTHRHTDKRTHGQTHRHTDTRTHGHTYTQTHRHTNTQIPTQKHSVIQTHRQTQRHTDTQTYCCSVRRRQTWLQSLAVTR